MEPENSFQNLFVAVPFLIDNNNTISPKLIRCFLEKKNGSTGDVRVLFLIDFLTRQNYIYEVNFITITYPIKYLFIFIYTIRP